MRRAIAAYYAMIETVDAQFGRVLDALRHAGQNLDEWVIVYTADHGEMLGEHGVFEKQKFFEESVRVPLLIRWPRASGPRVVDENVNLCDLFATLCDLCGIPVPEGLDSRSLVPLMRGDATAWDDESVSQFGPHNLMIKRGHLKYQYYGPAGGSEVLFDLQRDPGETRSFLGASEYTAPVAAFRQRLGELGHGPDADANYRNAGYAAASAGGRV